MASLDGVFKKEATPPLAALLAEHAAIDETSRLAGSLLVKIGDVKAGEALLGWLRNADDTAVPLARDWVLSTRTSALKRAWEVAVNKNSEFRSKAVKEAILAGLAEKKAGRQHQ